jgi:hypothetical protein
MDKNSAMNIDFMGFNGFEWDLVKFFMGLFIGTAWGLGLVFLDFMGLS